MESSVARPEIWFASVNEKYQGSEPFFWDTNEFGWTKELESNFEAISRELEAIYDRNLDSYADDELQFPPASWTKLVFYVWGVKNHKVCKAFPVTASLIERIPNMSSCFISLMAPGSKLRAHSGDTNTNVRYHLGLKVPVSNPDQCGMKVGDEVRSWQPGKSFMFLDAHYHYTWNNTDQKRYVMIIDVIRDEFASKWPVINTRIMLNLVLYSFAEKAGLRFIFRIPKNAILVGSYLLTPFWALLLRLQSRYNIIRMS